MLYFNIELIQSRDPILKDTQITLSFDCHPNDDQCHMPQHGTYDCRNPSDRQRGFVDSSLPAEMYGRTIVRHIKHYNQTHLEPSITLAPLGTFTLGSYERGTEWIQERQRGWSFNSYIRPPTKYNDFPAHTNVSFEWKRNENDPTDFPNSIRVGVIVDCLRNHHHQLPMSLSIDGSIGKPMSYFTKLEKHDVVITTDNKLSRDALIKQIESISYQNDQGEVVTFIVTCLDTSQDGTTVKLIGEGEILGGWDTRRASALTKVSDDGREADWKIEKLVNRRQGFHYKFIKESSREPSLIWETGENRVYTATDGTHPVLRQPVWEIHE